MLWADQERWPEVRQALSSYLLSAVRNAEPWASDPCYTRVQRVDGDGKLQQLRECTPEEYAADMLDPLHQGQDAEWHMVARCYGLNIVALQRPSGGDSIVPSVVRYPVQKPTEFNAVGPALSKY